MATKKMIHDRYGYVFERRSTLTVSAERYDDTKPELRKIVLAQLASMWLGRTVPTYSIYVIK